MFLEESVKSDYINFMWNKKFVFEKIFAYHCCNCKKHDFLIFWKSHLGFSQVFMLFPAFDRRNLLTKKNMGHITYYHREQSPSGMVHFAFLIYVREQLISGTAVTDRLP